MTGEKPILEWDESNIVDQEVKYRMDNKEEFDYDPNISEQAIREDIWDDSMFWHETADDYFNALTEYMRDKQKLYANKEWLVEVRNFGWRSSNGFKIVEAETGDMLLGGILPNCQCTTRIFNNGRGGFKIQNFHHDSPTGNEWYIVTLMNKKEWREFHKNGGIQGLLERT